MFHTKKLKVEKLRILLQITKLITAVVEIQAIFFFFNFTALSNIREQRNTAFENWVSGIRWSVF